MNTFKYHPSSTFNNEEIKDDAPGLILTENGSVYTNQNTAEEFRLISQLNFDNKKVVSLMTDYYGRRIWVLTEEGYVYSNYHGLGQIESGWKKLFEKKIREMTVWHGWMGNYAFIDQDGGVSYQFDTTTPPLPLSRVPGADFKVKKVYPHPDYVFIITEDNDVWSKGKHTYNNLGYGKPGQREEESFKKVPTLSNIKEIFLGNSSEVFFISYDGVLYKSKPGDARRPNSNTTERVVFTSPVKKIVPVDLNGPSYLVLTEDGSVYTKGYNYWGQLGLGNLGAGGTPYPNKDAFEQVTSINFFVNRKLPEETIFKKISSKGDTTLIITQEGNVYGTGKNTYGQLGLGDKDDRYELTSVNKKLNNTSI